MPDPSEEEVAAEMADVLAQVAELAATPEGIAMMRAEADKYEGHEE